MAGRVAELVERNLVVVVGARKLAPLRERHAVVLEVVGGAVALLVADVDATLGDDGLSPFLRQPGGLLVVPPLRELQPLGLLGVEDDEGPPDGPLELLGAVIDGVAVFVLANLPVLVALGEALLAGEEDDVLAGLALSDLAAESLDLAVGAPAVVAVAAGVGRHGQVEGVAPGIFPGAGHVLGERRFAGLPGLLPWGGALPDPFDQLVGKVAVVVLLFGCHREAPVGWGRGVGSKLGAGSPGRRGRAQASERVPNRPLGVVARIVFVWPVGFEFGRDGHGIVALPQAVTDGRPIALAL